MLHLGCGLDSRFFRLDPGPGVEWYDVDYPDVAELRRQLYPGREHYHVVAASVTDPAWLADVPARPSDADDRRGPDHVPHRGRTASRCCAESSTTLRPGSCSSTRSTGWASSRSGPTPWCGGPERRCTGASTGPTTSSRRCPGVRLLAWVSPFDVDAFADVALVLPGDGQGDVAGAGAALHGAVPPLRLLRPRYPSTGWLPRPPSKSADHGQRPRSSAHTNCSARTSGPHEGDREVHVRIGMVHLDELDVPVTAEGHQLRPALGRIRATVSSATAFSSRIARSGETPVTRHSANPRSCNPIV